MSSERQLVLVSNRGPATFERAEDGSLEATRGGGGLVTALTGLVHHRDALWVASAMSDEDAEAASEHGGKSFECDLDGTTYRIRLVESDPDAYEQFYNVVANPLLWFIQHYLWDLSNAPDIRRYEVDAYEQGYRAVNRDLAQAVQARALELGLLVLTCGPAHQVIRWIPPLDVTGEHERDD